MEKDAKIYVAGHTGLVGSSIYKQLHEKGYKNIIAKTHNELDLRRQDEVNKFFYKEKPDYVFIAAAKVGGIMAKQDHKAEFIYDNTMITTNLIHCSYKHSVKKLLYLGSSCLYPNNTPQPIKEEYLLSGPLESENEPYDIPKISGVKMCDYYRYQYGCNFISAMPTNIYGDNDNFNLETSHVIPAIIRKLHLAKLLDNKDYKSIRKDLQAKKFSVKKDYNSEWDNYDLEEILSYYGIKFQRDANLKHNNQEVIVKLWGTGSTYREFLHVSDLSKALLFLMNNYSDYGHINIGTGHEISIKELAKNIKKIVGYEGKIKWDNSKPDGVKRKLLDLSKIEKLGWESNISLLDGIKDVYKNYLK